MRFPGPNGTEKRSPSTDREEKLIQKRKEAEVGLVRVVATTRARTYACVLI